MLMIIFLKSDPHLPKKFVLFASMNSLKMMKNSFYFVLQTVFVLKFFEFLSQRFGHIQKTA